MDKLREFGLWIKDLFYDFGGLIDHIRNLPALYRENATLFWITVGVLAFVALLLGLLIVLLVRRGRKQKRKRRRGIYTPAVKAGRMFVPVESSGMDLDAVFLPLSERIVACGDRLSGEVTARIVKHSPKTLADIVTAYPRASAGLQNDLRQLVREQKMMEAYSRRLCEDGYPQGVLVDAWSHFPEDAVLRGFVELLGHPDERMQLAAARLLSAMQEPKCLPMLVLALVQPDRYVPARVAEVFVSIPQQSAALLSYMLPEVDDKHKERVLEIIAQTGAEFAPQTVLDCLKHKSYHIRAAAALALGSGRVVEAVPALVLAANDRKWQVRAAVAKALGLIGDSAAINILEILADDSEGWVANNAKEALELFRNA